jgi:hypothetical protein
VTKKQELKSYIKQGAPTQEKIRRKPKVYVADKRNTNKNKFKESFGSEGV